MTFGNGRTLSRRSWTADMWSWVKSEWNSRARDHRHDRERLYSPHRGASRANLASQLGIAKRCLTEKPENLRLSGRGIARDCGGAFQLVWQEDTCTTGGRERPTTTAHVAGQHRQQRAGVEEPASGGTPERTAGNNCCCCDGRSRADVRDAGAADCRLGLRPGRRCVSLPPRPALPTIAAGRHPDATHACTTAGSANRRKRTRTGRRLPLRLQPGVLPRATTTATARPDDARSV